MITHSPRRGLLLYLAGGVSRQFAIIIEASLLMLTMLTVLGSGYAEFGAAQAAVSLLPILVALPLGVLVDRVRRGTALAVIGWLGAGLIASLAAAIWLDAVTLPHVLLVAVGVGMLRVSGELAQDAYLPAVAGRDRFVPANAVLVIVGGLGSFGIAFLFGDSSGAIAVAVGVAALGFAASAWLFGLVRAPEEPAPPRAGAWGETAEGVRFTLTDPALRAIVVYLFGLTAMERLIEDFATRPPLGENGDVTLPGIELSWVAFAATSIGAVLAVLLRRRVGALRLAWAAVLVSQPFALLVLAGMDWGPISYVLGRLVPWAGVALAGVTLLSHRQAITPSRLLGRSGATLIVVLLVASVAGSALQVLSSVLIGPIGAGDAGGWPVVVLATAGVLACAVPMSRLRQPSHPAETEALSHEEAPSDATSSGEGAPPGSR
jgi:hypothetical protein